MMDHVQTEGVTLLLVEDDAELRELYELWLGRRFEVFAVGDGEAALDVLERREVDLLLLDRQLPQITGEELVVAARSRGVHVPVVFVSSWNEADWPLTIDCEAYLVKPVRSADLVGAVERVLDDH